MATQTTELQYMFIDSQASYDLINANVAAGDRTGDLQTDLKKALISLLSLSGANYSLDDLWKRYQLSTAVTNDGDTIGGPSRTPPEHRGNHPKHFLPRDRIRNDGGTGGFTGGTNNPVGVGPDDLPNLSTLSIDASAPVFATAYNATATIFSPGGTYQLTHETVSDGGYSKALSVAGTPEDGITGQQACTALGSQVRGGAWNGDGTAFLACKYETHQLAELTNSGSTPYHPSGTNELDTEAATRATNTADSLDQPWDCCFGSSGAKLIVSFRDNSDAASKIAMYSLSTPYDITTASLDGSQGLTGARGIVMSDDGTRIYVTRAGVDLIEQYDLSTAYDVTSIGSPVTSLDWTAIRTSAAQIIGSMHWDETLGNLYFNGFINASTDTYHYWYN